MAEETDNSPNPEEMAVDSEEVQDEETDLMFAYSNRDDDSTEALDLLSDYLPGEDDWSAKTRLEEDHPEKLIAIEQLTKFYPEIEEHSEILEQWVHDYEKRLTSVDALSREEYTQILKAMTGGSHGTDDGSSVLQRIMGADEEDGS